MIQIFLGVIAKLFANSGDPDQILQSVASDLALHCLGGGGGGGRGGGLQTKMGLIHHEYGEVYLLKSHGSKISSHLFKASLVT